MRGREAARAEPPRGQTARRRGVEAAAERVSQAFQAGARLMLVVAQDAAEAEGVGDAVWAALQAACPAPLSPARLTVGPSGRRAGGDALLDCVEAAVGALTAAGEPETAAPLRSRLGRLAARGEGVILIVDACAVAGRAPQLAGLVRHAAHLADLAADAPESTGWAGARVVLIGPEALVDALAAVEIGTTRRAVQTLVRLPQALASAAAARALLDPWPDETPAPSPGVAAAPEARRSNPGPVGPRPLRPDAGPL